MSYLTQSIVMLSFLAGICMTFCATSANANETQQQAQNYFSSGDNTPYLTWLSAHRDDYDNQIFLPKAGSEQSLDEGVALHWSIDNESNSIQIAVAARATGWLGFGIAEAGGMPGSDIALFTSNDQELIDAHVGATSGMPIQDECQNWNLSRSTSEDGFIIFEAERLLDTGDEHDRPIMDDISPNSPPHRVIAAWGDEESVSYHGQNRVRGAVRFHGEGVSDETKFANTMAANSDGSVAITARNHPVTEDETEYARFCFSYEDLVNGGLPNGQEVQAIGFESIIDPNSAAYVHHMILYAHKQNNGCNDFAMDMVFVWAPGEGPLSLPDEVGSTLGAEGYRSFELEIHYNNPSGDAGITDNSGARVYFTSTLRPHELGIYQVGDPLLALGGTDVGDGLTRHDFDCPSTCSATTMENDSVTVFRELLHMHEKGLTMTNTQVRDGAPIRSGSVEFYDFEQAGVYSVIQDSFALKRGDSFRTTCYYDANQGDKFGLASDDEMCIAFLLYYPKQSFPAFYCGPDHFVGEACTADYESKTLVDLGEIGAARGNNGVSNNSCSVLDDDDDDDDSASSSLQVGLGTFVAATFLAFAFMLY